MDRDLLDKLTAWRRHLHAHPELGREEKMTSAFVQEKLTELGVPFVANVGGHGVVATLTKGSSERTVGLRADMDALPLQEETEVPHRSRYDGRMHGCGHDGHTTMLLAAARYLHDRRPFDGTVHLIFQPGEEGHAGAKAMIDDGLFQRFPVESVYAMHNWPGLKPGSFGIRHNAMMAAADRITIEITGKGGHGAHPYATVDPVVVAAHIITAVQTIVSRNVRAIDSAVISLCAMQAGDPGAFSVIPGTARLVGTVRTFNPEVQAMVEKRLHEVCSGVALGLGASAHLNYERIYPATINTRDEARFAVEVAQKLVGHEHVDRNMDPSMGAEDFSFMLQVKPGAYLRLGQGAENGQGACFLHNSRYDFNDDVLPLGAALHAGLIEQGMPLADEPSAAHRPQSVSPTPVRSEA